MQENKLDLSADDQSKFKAKSLLYYIIPSGPKKCFHFSEINNSVTNCSKILISVLFYHLYDHVSIINSFFQSSFHILRAIEQEVRVIFFLTCVRLSVDQRKMK